MAEFVYSPEARLDLLEIREYTARDNLDEADRVEQEIKEAVSMLASQPELGHWRHDLTSNRSGSGASIPTSSCTIRRRVRWK